MPVPTINVLKCAECEMIGQPQDFEWFLIRNDNGGFEFSYYSERLMPDYDQAVHTTACLQKQVEKHAVKLIQAHTAGRTK